MRDRILISVNERPLKHRLRALEPLVALLVKMPCAAQIESAGHAGFDFAIIDTEHGPGGSFELEHHLRAADSVQIPVLVRVPDEGHAAIHAALDSGAAGIVVPHVLSADGARRVVSATRYPPNGRRGFALSTRAGGYGSTTVAKHLDRAAAETCVMVQIEDREALENVRDIATTDGVDGVFIGDSDLSLSLGHPGEVAHPDVTAAIDGIVTAAGDSGVPVVCVTSMADSTRWFSRGANVLTFVGTQLIRDAHVAAVHAGHHHVSPSADG